MMHCDECGHGMKVDENAERRYDFGGLPHVTLRGLRVTTCPKCGAEDVGIPKIEQLHRVLATHFLNQTRPLAPNEVRFLRKYIGLSTADFARCAGVTRETVSRWETGAVAIGPVADRLVRLLVATSTPVEDYAAKDALCGIDSTRGATKRPSKFALTASPDGWRPDREPAAA